MERKAQINIEVQLNEEQIPQNIIWQTNDHGVATGREVKAVLISLFDKESRDTFKLDLWTNEMQIQEMDQCMYHSLSAMAEIYKKATGNEMLYRDFSDFVQHFGKQIQSQSPVADSGKN